MNLFPEYMSHFMHKLVIIIWNLFQYSNSLEMYQINKEPKKHVSAILTVYNLHFTTFVPLRKAFTYAV